MKPVSGTREVASDSDSSDGEGNTRNPGLDTTWTGDAARPCAGAGAEIR